MANLTYIDIDADQRNLENHSLHHAYSQLQRNDAKPRLRVRSLKLKVNYALR